jgi:polysaccharide export outer membrane protein
MKRYHLLLHLVWTALFFTACTPQRKIVYFQDGLPAALAQPGAYTLRIYPGDILSINIFAINAEAFPYLAAPADRPTSDTRSAYEKGYVVGENGEVNLPLAGRVNLNGMTLAEANRAITAKYKEYMDDPLVTVKKLNFKVTVLGEVNKPGTYPVPNERITLAEALGYAGDLNTFGDRTAVKVLRSENNQHREFTVDLTRSSSLTTDAWFLHPDDVVYVAPVRRRAFQNINPSVTLFASVISTAIIAVTFFLTQTK